MHHTTDPNLMVNLKINGIPVTVPGGTLILDAAKKVGINIPTLCYHPDLKVRATCRICLVEFKGQKKLRTACSNEVWEGAEIITNSKIVRDTRRTVLELLLAEHKPDCLQCVRNTKCELQRLAKELSVEETSFISAGHSFEIEDQHPAIVRDPNKCIKCGRCVEVCQDVQQVSAINTAHRSAEFEIGTPYHQKLDQTTCVSCGQCIAVCPVGALYEKDDTGKVQTALDNPGIHVVVQIEPAIRVALAKEFDIMPGNITPGKMVTVLRRLGFNKVFDTRFMTDITSREAAYELFDRLCNNGVLPMLTSHCAGWINFMEKTYPEILNHLSTCKSPQQMFGAIAKTFYAEQSGISPEKIFVVSIMPCVAKKYEGARTEMSASGQRDVDAVLTTKELVKMIKHGYLDLAKLEESEFDDPLGISEDDMVICGSSGGVMEGAVRTVYTELTGYDLEQFDFEAIPDLEGAKEADINIAGQVLKVAIVDGLKNARVLMDQIKQGSSKYHMIEVMCCPIGCSNNVRQPFGTTAEIEAPIYQGHKSPAVLTLYGKFLGNPLGPKSQELLHTNYIPQYRK